MVKFDFDPTEYENEGDGSGRSRDPIPEGVYSLALVEADTKAARSGNGIVMTCKFEVTEGSYKGKWIWERFNIVNSNDTAQRIARGRVSKWATAAGKPGATDTDKLMGRKFFAKIKIEEGSGGYGPQNVIDGFVMPGGEAEAPKVQPKAEPKPKAEPAKAPAGEQKRPWE